MQEKENKYYKHVDIYVSQRNKKQNEICGDHFVFEKNSQETYAILCDGLGSGIKANLAAVMASSRLKALLNQGFTLQKACESLAITMAGARTGDIPFSAFSVARILKDGHASIFSFQMPAAILVEDGIAQLLPQIVYSVGSEIITESNVYLKTGASILLISDGVTQAGLGEVFKEGWGSTKICEFINHSLNSGIDLKDIPDCIVRQVSTFSSGIFHDDTSAVLLNCRKGTVLNMFSGPPSKKHEDEKWVKEFMSLEGQKIVCGSSTASMFARTLHLNVELADMADIYLNPPQYIIEGIDLVTEGAVTLNQAFNILDEDSSKYNKNSTVTKLCNLLKDADHINFWIGSAQNPGSKDIIFRQMGVYPRTVIIRKISQLLKKMGKTYLTKLI